MVGGKKLFASRENPAQVEGGGGLGTGSHSAYERGTSLSKTEKKRTGRIVRSSMGPYSRKGKSWEKPASQKTAPSDRVGRRKKRWKRQNGEGGRRRSHITETFLRLTTRRARREKMSNLEARAPIRQSCPNETVNCGQL